MNKMTRLFRLAAVAAATPLWAVEVSNVKARQRWPWDGLVDITCTVSGIDGTDYGLDFAVAAVMPDSSVHNATNFWVAKDGKKSFVWCVPTNGNYRLIWDARADLGPELYSNVVVRVTVVSGHARAQLWEGGPYWAMTNVGVLAPAHDAAQAHWGGAWRMPTNQELSDLVNKCNWIWTERNDGVKGWTVTGRGDYDGLTFEVPFTIAPRELSAGTAEVSLDLPEDGYVADGAAANLGAINGVVSLLAGDDLGALAPKAASGITHSEGEATIFVPASAGRFVKAVIGVAAPEEV